MAKLAANAKQTVNEGNVQSKKAGDVEAAKAVSNFIKNEIAKDKEVKTTLSNSRSSITKAADRIVEVVEEEKHQEDKITEVVDEADEVEKVVQEESSAAPAPNMNNVTDFNAFIEQHVKQQEAEAAISQPTQRNAAAAGEASQEIKSNAKPKSPQILPQKVQHVSGEPSRTSKAPSSRTKKQAKGLPRAVFYAAIGFGIVTAMLGGYIIGKSF